MPYKDTAAKSVNDHKRYISKAESIRAQVRGYYQSNRTAIRARRLQLSDKHKAKNNQRERDRRLMLRMQMIAAYGGKCVCCGESEVAFLELDHINGGGRAHRRELGSSSSKTMYLWLQKRGWPREGFQLLCANCNQGRQRNGGTCPHSARKANPVLGADGSRTA